MDYQTNPPPREVLEIHSEAQRRGFIAGIIFCVAAKYFYDRRKKQDEYPFKAANES